MQEVMRLLCLIYEVIKKEKALANSGILSVIASSFLHYYDYDLEH